MKQQISLLLVLAIIFQPIFALGAAQRTIQADQIQSADTTKTYTLPAASDAIVGKDSAQTLTNKTLTAPQVDYLKMSETGTPSGNPPAGFRYVYTKSDGRTYQRTSDGTETYFAPASNNVNYFEKNATAENDTLGWVGYADAAGILPVDGVGGTSGIVFGRTSTSPLEGLQSFTFTKPATNQQGSGVAFDFTIPPAEARQQKTQRVTFATAIISGTYAAGDVVASIYDKTNNQIVSTDVGPGAPVDAGATSEFSASWVPSANSTSYRFILHVASTSASAYSIELDAFLNRRDPYVGLIGIARGAGEIFPISGGTCPAGSIDANGAAVSRSTYGDLFAASGTTYGAGDGSTTFNVVNMNGRFARGDGTNNLGFGAGRGEYQNDQLQGHGHNMRTFENQGGALAGLYYGNNNSNRNDLMNAGMYDIGYGAPRVGTETRPSSVGVHYCVQTKKNDTTTTFTPNQLMDVMGVITYQAGATCGQGSITADGSAVSRSTYGSLFNKIGVLYGAGNGTTTFNVPDLRGIFVRGAGTNGTGVGGVGGKSGTLGSYQADQFASHRHGVANQTSAGNQGFPVINVGNHGDTNYWNFNNPSAYSSAVGGNETNPANIALTPCISYVAAQAPLIMSATSGDFRKDGSVAMTGSLNAGGFKITNAATPTAATDVATKAYVDSATPTVDFTPYFKKDGTVNATGNFNLGAFKITNMGTPIAPTDATNKAYVDAAVSNVPAPDLTPYFRKDGMVLATGAFNLGAFKITNMATPTAVADAATKGYVDTAIAAIPASTPTDTTPFVKTDGTRAFTADQSFGSHKATNVLAPTAGTDAANKAYVDTAVAAVPAPDLSAYYRKDGVTPATGDFNMNNHKLKFLADPTLAQDAATKAYVDSTVNGAIPDLNGYFKTDGSTPMTGDADFGGHQIKEASGVSVTGNSKSFGIVLPGTSNVVGAQTGDQGLIVMQTGDGGSVGLTAGDNGGIQLTTGENGEITLGSGANGHINLNSDVVSNGKISLNGHKIEGLSDPQIGSDAVNKLYVDTAVSNLGTPDLSEYFKTDGSTPMQTNASIGFTDEGNEFATAIHYVGSDHLMVFGTGGYKVQYRGQPLELYSSDSMKFSANSIKMESSTGQDPFNLDMSSLGKIVNAVDPTAAQDVATKHYVDTHAGGGAWSADQDAANHKLVNLAPPTADGDAVSKAYLKDAFLNGISSSSSASGFILDTAYSTDGTAEVDQCPGCLSGNAHQTSRFGVLYDGTTMGYVATQDNVGGYESYLVVTTPTGDSSKIQLASDGSYNDGFTVQRVFGGSGGYFYLVGLVQFNYQSSNNNIGPFGVQLPAIRRYDAQGNFDASWGPNGDGTVVLPDSANYDGTSNPVVHQYQPTQMFYTSDNKIHVFALIDTQGNTDINNNLVDQYAFEQEVFDVQSANWETVTDTLGGVTGSNEYVDDGNGGNQNTVYNPYLNFVTMATNSGKYYAQIRFDDGHNAIVREGATVSAPVTGAGQILDDGSVITFAYSGQGSMGKFRVIKPDNSYFDSSTPLPIPSATNYSYIKIFQTSAQGFGYVTGGNSPTLSLPEVSLYALPNGLGSNQPLTVTYEHQSLVYPDALTGHPNNMNFLWADSPSQLYMVANETDVANTPVTISRFTAGSGSVNVTIKPGDFQKDGSVKATGDFDLNTHKIKNIATPTVSTDAVNKSYVDSAFANFSASGTINMNRYNVQGANAFTTVDANNEYNSILVPASLTFKFGNAEGMLFDYNHNIDGSNNERGLIGMTNGLFIRGQDGKVSIGEHPDQENTIFSVDRFSAKTDQSPNGPNDITNKAYVDNAVTAYGYTRQSIGEPGNPATIQPSQGIQMLGSVSETIWFIQSTDGSVFTAAKQILDGNVIGQKIILSGQSDTNVIHLHDGNGISLKDGNSDLILYSNSRAQFFWDGTVWEQL